MFGRLSGLKRCSLVQSKVQFKHVHSMLSEDSKLTESCMPDNEASHCRDQAAGAARNPDKHQLDSQNALHLLENAAKYSEVGQPIFITAELRDPFVITSVADRGAGIDGFDRALIFDKFYLGQEQRNRVQGTVMGFAIVKAIIEAHEGKVEVTSQALGLSSRSRFLLRERLPYFACSWTCAGGGASGVSFSVPFATRRMRT